MESLLDDILAIVEATRRTEFLLIGVSPRGTLRRPGLGLLRRQKLLYSG